MAENYDDISCEDVIYSEDYQDYIKEYFQDFSSIAGTYHPVCIEAIGSRYAVMHLRLKRTAARIQFCQFTFSFGIQQQPFHLKIFAAA